MESVTISVSSDLLSAVDVPEEMNQKWVLFDVCEVIDGFETVITDLIIKAYFSPLREALKNAKSYEDDTEGLSSVLKDGNWNEHTNTLKDDKNLIVIKNVREITPQQAVIFKLGKSF